MGIYLRVDALILENGIFLCYVFIVIIKTIKRECLFAFIFLVMQLAGLLLNALEQMREDLLVRFQHLSLFLFLLE